MPDDTSDRPNRHHWPPILYVLLIAAVWILQRQLPLPAAWSTPAVAALGWLLFLAGAAIGVAALKRFHTDDTPFDPTAPARHLSTTGIYRFTRNPMYLGALVAFTGLGLALGLLWLLLLQPLLAAALIRLAIEREEAYLHRRFGREYETYAASVRRWI